MKGVDFERNSPCTRRLFRGTGARVYIETKAIPEVSEITDGLEIGSLAWPNFEKK